MIGYRVLLAVLSLAITAVSLAKEVATHVETVEQFVAAFNAKDSNAMATMVTDDIEWLSIQKTKVSVEVKGKAKLVESMDAYFKSCPTCRSELSEMINTTTRVSAVEVASWQSDGTLKSQKAFSVYEFSDGLIARVYYFPAEK